MSAELADDFAYIDSAIELWSELHERFGQSNGPLVYQLKKEIDALKQENLSIIAYYCKIKKLWDELQSLRAFPTCTCGALTRCTCQFLKKLADLEGEDRLMQFLLGLNSGFDSTITNILSMDPLPTINRAFSITQQIEKQKEVSGSVEHVTESSAMAARRMIRNGVQKFGQNYSKTGRRRNSGSKRVGGQSNGQRFAANVHASQDADSPLDSDGNIDNSRISSDLLSAICQEVMKTMKGKQSVGETRSTFANFAGNDSLTCAVSKTGENCLWIVDSGAFDHMVFDERMFVCKMFLDKPIRVVLPDGTYKFVKMDPSNEEMVGHGRRQNGLYYFTKEVTEKTEAAGSVFNENNAVCCNSVGNKQISVLPNKTATGDISKENKGTMNSGLWYYANSDLEMKGYSDADWGGCQFSSRSLSAYTVFLGSCLVSWKTKKQRSVSKSSAESEYRSMSVTNSEMEWLHDLLEDLQVKIELPVTLSCDNTSAEHLAQNPMFHEKTKHLKRDMHYVRDLVEAGFLKTEHVSTEYQLADLLTKSLAVNRHDFLCSKLGLQNKVQLEGGVKDDI
uniref:Uncharacterized protein n=1 Tax=Chenopodium quinoa TaxID=63459 RepID=A0A803LWA5_CHEQI